MWPDNPNSSEPNDNESARSAFTLRLHKLRRRLSAIVRIEIRSALRKGKTDVETIAQRVEESNSVLLQQLAPLSTAADLRVLIRHMLKHTSVSEEVGAERAYMAAAQPELDFENIEEFRGIPYNITYKEIVPAQQGAPAKIQTKFIPYLDTVEEQRVKGLEHLGEGIERDQQRYYALKSGNEFASRLVALYGDLPLRDLYRLYLDEGKERHGNGS